MAPGEGDDLAVARRCSCSTRTENKPMSASLKILGKALQSSADKAVSQGAQVLLVQLLGTAVAGPLSAALGTVAKELIGALLETTSAVEKKLDTLLREPATTAMRMLEQIASLPLATPESRREVQRQLAVAYDRLDKAYTNAEKHFPEKLDLIRYYQTLVAALRPDAHEFVDLFVAQFRRQIPQMAARSTALRERAREMEPEVEAARMAVEYAPRVGVDTTEGRAFAGIELARIGGEQRDCLAEADELERAAGELELFCRFVSKLSQQTLADARRSS